MRLDHAEVLVAEGAVLADDGGEDVLAAFLHEEPHEADDERRHLPVEELADDGLLLLAGDDGAAEEELEVARGVEALLHALHVLVDALGVAGGLGLFVEGLGVAAGHDCVTHTGSGVEPRSAAVRGGTPGSDEGASSSGGRR